MYDESMPDSVTESQLIMEAAAKKAPGGSVETYAPYLRAAIAYWRLKEKSTDDMAAQVEAVTRRITLEEQFRGVAGRSYHTVTDAITAADVAALPEPS
jgi:hypothetical protein